MASTDWGGTEQGWKDSIVASAPSSVTVGEFSLSNPTADTGVHAMEPAQDAGGPDDGPKFSTSRGRSAGARTPNQRSTVKDPTPRAKQDGQKKKRLIGMLAAGVTTALLAVAGITTIAILYKSKSAQVASADTEAPGLPPSSSLSVPPPKSKESVKPTSKPSRFTPEESCDNKDRIEKEMEWTPEAVQARKEECAEEVTEAPHAELLRVDGVRVREKRRLKKHTIRARQQEELIFDAINPANYCLHANIIYVKYSDSYMHIQKLVGDDSLRKLRFMTLHRLLLFDDDYERDFEELWKTADQTPTNYDLDHENRVQVAPYVKELREALANATNANQLACQFIHIISNKKLSPDEAKKVETFPKLEKRLEILMNSGALENDLLEMSADENEFLQNEIKYSDEDC
eukprot:GHVT01060605.1.p1 GENE.GHVT01060605.1~~GHVT01060605.1.p1  ORF type:complete len:402 (+),score=55.46 GHVT01060605.1:699-1904(+)